MHKPEALAERRSPVIPALAEHEDRDFRASLGSTETKPNQTETEEGMAVASHLENHFL